MKQNFFRWLSMAVVIGLVSALAACGSSSSSANGKIITISGAFALYPMVVKWGEEYQKLHPDVQFDISAGGAGKGMTDALTGAVDIGMVSRAIKPEEEAQGAFWVPVVRSSIRRMKRSNR